MFGWGCSTASTSSTQLSNAGANAASSDAAAASSRLAPGGVSLAAAAGDGVSWAPLPSDSAAAQKTKQPPPFTVKSHDVKAHLQDRSTAVVNLCSVVDAPGDVMFDLLADPHQHERIFDAIQSATAELVSEEGPVQKWRLDYRARWKFWKIGGVCDNRLWMTTDRERGTVSFVLREPGFLRKYEGTWTITRPDGRGAAAPADSDAAPTAAAAAAAGPDTADTCAARWPLLRLSTDSSTLPPSSTASTEHAAYGDNGNGPRFYAVSLSSRSDSKSSSGSGSSDSLGHGSTGSLAEAAELPTARSGRTDDSGRGRGGGGGGLAGLFASINNPFFATTSLPLDPFRTPGKAGADAGAPAITTSTGATAPAPPPPAVPRSFPTTIQVRKAISPNISPPYPLNQVLKSHASGQVSDMLEGLLAATARRMSEREEAAGNGGQRKLRGGEKGRPGGRRGER